MSSADSSRSPDTPTGGHETQRTRGQRTPSTPSQESTVEPTELLSLLGDDHARNVLRVLSEGPRPAAELVDELAISRPTVYRRLDRLESAGLVESSMRIREGGHHRKRFHLAVDSAEVGFDGDGLTVEVSA
jgi:DNA-binding transcriptional ArsR family regulator